MADQPSRALVLYGDGLAHFVDPSHTHLHSLASKATCGFLSLPNAPSSENENERIIREFAHLLDACETYKILGSQDTSLVPTLPERFMGMKAAIITDDQFLQSFAGRLGFTVLSFNDINGNDHSHQSSSVDFFTSELLKLIGLQEGMTMEVTQFDLVFMHIGAGEKMDEHGSCSFAKRTEYINALVASITQKTQPGSDLGSCLHLSLVMSYGLVTEIDENLSVCNSKYERSQDLLLLFPKQSYTMKGEKPRVDVR
ncbi:hypothetical protein K2173_016676 [Erythroxylum novogranatense]|uniref:Uncharacterized protein n=1 Tax=Erythroxylum novogranatense TaxID=1862640 RepID=A0AAV8SGT4_9ROSI|nr:hypothetical protein K2173_016676 [Erythroxylum novogranatense]